LAAWRRRPHGFQGTHSRQGTLAHSCSDPIVYLSESPLGGWGTCIRATHDELNQPVSLKVFPSSLKNDHEKLARMEREFRATAELDHPNIVRSFQIGQAGDIHYLALQDLKGETLLDRLNREGAIPYPTACKLILDVARGLAHLHEDGLVHRDISPANMWVTEGGNCMLMELGAVRNVLGGALVLPRKSKSPPAKPSSAPLIIWPQSRHEMPMQRTTVATSTRWDAPFTTVWQAESRLGRKTPSSW